MLHMNKILWIANAIAYLFAFVTGFVVSKFIDLPSISINEKVDVVAVLQIVATFVAAFLVARVLDKQKQDDRIEKDLILKRIEDVYLRVEQNYVHVLDGKIEYAAAAAQIKRILTTVSSVMKLLEARKISISERSANAVITNIRKLRDLLTDTPNIKEHEIAEARLSIQVKDGIIHLSKDRLIQIESEYEKIKDSILVLQLEINKA